MLPRRVGDVHGPARHAPRGGVVRAVERVRGLEHVPVGEGAGDEVQGEEGVVGVGEDVPGVGGGDGGEVVVRVAEDVRKRGGCGVEEELRGEGHAGDGGGRGEVGGAGGGPGAEGGGGEGAAGGGGEEGREEVLRVGFDALWVFVSVLTTCWGTGGRRGSSWSSQVGDNMIGLRQQEI